MTHVADEILGKIARQQADLFRRVREGTLDPALVSRAIQDVIDGKFAPMRWAPPTWWCTPDQQLERARQLWPGIVLPEPPAEFLPRTKSEVLLLHVPDSLVSLWDKIEAPAGRAKHYWEGVKSDERNLRLSPNKIEFTVPVWLAFDPEHGRGERPSSFWGQTDCAASEVLSAIIQFPDWPLDWIRASSSPFMSGYQLKYDESWSDVPYVFYDRLGLELNSSEPEEDDMMSSPSVREC